MSGGMPELGSKISLISKADIRYEGRLYTVDPQECTIALSTVRSFGTEDRETQFQIAPQSQIYDYILFRGSDIKDIRVVNNSLPHPNDPAIMQVQNLNGQHLMPHFPMPTMNAPHAPPMGVGGYGPFGGMGGLGNMGGVVAGAGGPSMAPGSAANSFMGANMQTLQQSQQGQKGPQHHPQKQPISVLDMLASASRSTTPISLISRKSPAAADTGSQMNQQHSQHHQQSQHSHQQHANQNNQNQLNQNSAGHGGNSRDAGHKRQNHQQRGNNQRNSANNNDFYNQRDRRDSGRNIDNFNNQHHDMRNNYNNQRNQGGQNRGWTLNRGQNNPNNIMRRGGGGGGSGGGGGGGRGRMQNQAYRPIGGIGGNQNKPRNNKNTIKFEQDFDFEQANNKFEELRSQLSKLKVAEEPKTEQVNGETDKKDDSGNETGAGEHEPEDEEITVGYDKTKSFFDNISCEAAQDRTKNKKNDWRQERKLNSETFGVSSTRRGSYRGRGNYYNRNMGFGIAGSGTYNRGYRGGNNYRNRSNNHMAANGGASVPRDNSNTNANAANTSTAASQANTDNTAIAANVANGGNATNGANPTATSATTNNNGGTTTNISAGNLKKEAQQKQEPSVPEPATAPVSVAKAAPQEIPTQAPQVAATGEQ